MKKSHFKTIVLSDIHLGTEGSKAKEVVDFLKHHTCDLLLLNGDIIDGWQLQKYGNWKKKHTRFIRTVMKMMESQSTQVVYLRGNHDDFLDQIIPLRIGKNFHIQREFIYESFGKKYLVTHGDIFDSVTTNMRWIAKLGDVGYTFLLWLNKVYNQSRVRQGKPYYSLSQKIKARVKQAVSYINDYEQELAGLAQTRGCQGVICGHIHQPAIKTIGQIQYLNSGDWVESLTALTEDFEGNWALRYYEHDPFAALADTEEDADEPEEFAEVLEMKSVARKMGFV